MKKIRFMLEYQCSPIWIENEKGELLCNGFPVELTVDRDLMRLLEEIRKTFDNLYENSDSYLGYHGFSDKIEKQSFFSKVNQVIILLNQSLSNKYQIQIDIDEKNF